MTNSKMLFISVHCKAGKSCFLGLKVFKVFFENLKSGKVQNLGFLGF